LKKIKLYSDHDLASRLKNGDQYAFEILFYKYKNKLKGFVVNLTPPHIEPDEIVQKVFIKIWIRRNEIKPEKSFSSLLYTIAKNEVIDQLRSAVNKKIYLAGSDFISDLNLSEDVVPDLQQNMEQKIIELIKSLPERRKQIFELNRFEGLSYKQVAKQLDISENTVDTQIRKALDFLRTEIRKHKDLILLYFFH
jgi:RNA polymerase sigma-70 factor (ECF subfamily)